MIVRVLTALLLVPLLSSCGKPAPPERQVYAPYSQRVPVDPAPRRGFERVMLDAHNRARSAYGSQPLQWDAALVADAQAYANEMARTGIFRHDPDRDRRRRQGENIWMGTRGAFTYEQMVGSMIDEQRYFRRGAFPDNSVTGRWQDVGHYTQIIWPSTTRLGCALASNRTDDYLVCRYSPPGNIDGRAL